MGAKRRRTRKTEQGLSAYRSGQAPSVYVEHAPAPDTQERLRRAFELVLQAARAEEEVKLGHEDDANIGEGVDRLQDEQ